MVDKRRLENDLNMMRKKYEHVKERLDQTMSKFNPRNVKKREQRKDQTIRTLKKQINESNELGSKLESKLQEMLKKYESERQKVQYLKRRRQQQQESETIKELKGRVAQLENEKQILEESMNDLISEEDFNFFEDGRYNDEIRTVYYDLLSKNVSIENCRHVVRTVLETFTKRKVGRLPKTSVAACMMVEAK